MRNFWKYLADTAVGMAVSVGIALLIVLLVVTPVVSYFLLSSAITATPLAWFFLPVFVFILVLEAALIRFILER